MELSSWCNYGITRNVNANVNSRMYNRIVSFKELVAESKNMSRWRSIWMKMKKEKKKNKNFVRCSSTRMQFSYDHCDYAKNFEQSSTCCDPDQLSRSFSARFAVPAKRSY
ncbi:hypothetical protein M5689_021631 [Euphorbia peplus]|nr:hypothetical protein M5689_021631 [Euphorbia peplus]